MYKVPFNRTIRGDANTQFDQMQNQNNYIPGFNGGGTINNPFSKVASDLKSSASSSFTDSVLTGINKTLFGKANSSKVSNFGSGGSNFFQMRALRVTIGFDPN